MSGFKRNLLTYFVKLTFSLQFLKIIEVLRTGI